LSEGLELLSRAGLNNAFLFIRRSRELSDGQKYRYKTAKLMESGKQWWIADDVQMVENAWKTPTTTTTHKRILKNMD